MAILNLKLFSIPTCEQSYCPIYPLRVSAMRVNNNLKIKYFKLNENIAPYSHVSV